MSRGTQQTIWFNVTSSCHWNGPDVGVIRTEKQLAHHLERLLGPAIRKCKWNGVSFYELGSGESKLSAPVAFNEGDALLTFGLDWEHSFHYQLGKLRREKNVNIVACCYDLIPVLFPQYCVADTRDFFSTYFINVAEGAEAIFCISQNTKRDLEAFLCSAGARVPRIEVFRLGDNLPFVQSSATPRVRGILERPYALYVSTIERRKNHITLYHAMRVMAQANRRSLSPQMVFVGMHGWGVDDLMSDIALDPLVKENIVHLEKVDDQELSTLYKHAACIVFPSHYEGWGLSVAEALNYGKVVLASNTSSLPEIGGELVTYLDPLNPREWAKALFGLFANESQRLLLEEKVRKNYKPWFWSDSARSIIDRLPA